MTGIGLGPGGLGTELCFLDQKKKRASGTRRASKEEETIAREKRKGSMEKKS
jgi:hypothetical protein